MSSFISRGAILLRIMRKPTRLVMLTLLLLFQLVWPAVLRAGDKKALRSPCGKTQAPRDQAIGSSVASGPSVRVWEQRSPQRFDEDLLYTDGLEFQRDINVYVCSADVGVTYVVRAWVRPKNGQWREIRIGELTQDERAALIGIKGEDPDTALVLPGILKIDKDKRDDTPYLATVAIPIRREGLTIGDSVHVEVRTDCDTRTVFPACKKEVINEFLTIDRYGLLPGFSDSILLVKRLGINPNTNASGQIDSANYRPAPGINFGLTYLHRKHPFLQFLEPGFGFNLSLVSWKDAALDASGQLVRPVNDPVEVTVGAMGSMFDNVITVVYGWNTNVATDRAFVGVGFSVVGIIRKIARTSR